MNTPTNPLRWTERNIPCQAACPALTNVPGYIAAIAAGDFARAYAINQQANIFPGVLGRICARPCEDACRHAYPGNGDAVAICSLKRAAADHRGAPTLACKDRKKPAPATGKTVAIVGGGPAGLAAAHDLTMAGHQVTVFDSYREPGGMMVQGIPKFRLPREIVHEEIRSITDLGVQLISKTLVGKDKPLEEVLESYDAVILAAGTLKPNFLELPGKELNGVVHGLHFMERVNADDTADVGKNVVVVGGGFTAMDCARSAIRLGAAGVGIYYRRSREEMPVSTQEIQDTEHEGVALHELVTPTAFLGKAGRVHAVSFLKTQLGEPDESGRRSPVPIEGSEFTIDADLVLLASGQNPDYNPLAESLTTLATRQGIDPESLFVRGRIAVDETTHQTKLARLFATGDYVTGATTIIQALGRARKTARAVDAFLCDKKPAQWTIAWEAVEKTGRTRADDVIPLASMPMLDTAERGALTTEVEKGFSVELAKKQARRCYLCTHIFTINREECIFCEWCLQTRPKNLNCIKRVKEFHYDDEGEIVGVVEAKAGDDVVAIWIDEKQCIRCGACMRTCPVDAITLHKGTLCHAP